MKWKKTARYCYVGYVGNRPVVAVAPSIAGFEVSRRIGERWESAGVFRGHPDDAKAAAVVIANGGTVEAYDQSALQKARHFDWTN